MVSEGVTVLGRFSAGWVEETCTASLRLARGSGASSMGESRTAELLLYFGVNASPLEGIPNSKCGKVRLRGRWEWLLLFCAAGRSGRPDGGMKGEGAVPESGVKNGDVGLIGPGEKDDGAVSVNALCNELVLCEWNGPCLLLKVM